MLALHASLTSPPDFATVFDREFSYVWRAVRRLGVREADLEDVTQEVFLRVHRALPDYDPARPIRPWLFAFAARVASDYRKLARHRVEVMGVAIEPLDPAARPEELVLRREALDTAARAIDAIDFDQREVFLLHEIDGYSIVDVAAALGIPSNTAYSRLRLARESFAAAARRIRAQERGR
jgi:RNA polymerase sigma-70 factor (ECF subfamily)